MTGSRVIAVSLGLLTLVAVAGCGSGQYSDTSKSISTQNTQGSGTDASNNETEGSGLPDALDVSEADDGTSLTIQQGGTIVLTLEANPSTGYGWQMDEEDPEASLLLQVGEPVFKSDDPELAGAGGTITYTFTAADAGEMTVSFIYLGPDIEEGPSKTFSFDLTVK